MNILERLNNNTLFGDESIEWFIAGHTKGGLCHHPENHTRELKKFFDRPVEVGPSYGDNVSARKSLGVEKKIVNWKGLNQLMVELVEEDVKVHWLYLSFEVSCSFYALGMVGVCMLLTGVVWNNQ